MSTIYNRRYTNVKEVTQGWDKLIAGEKIKIRNQVYFSRSEDSNESLT